MRSIRSWIAPHTADPGAGWTARALDEHRARHERELAVAEKAVAELRAMFESGIARYGPEMAYDFIDRMEAGRPQTTPELSQYASLMRSALDTLRDKIRELGDGKLEHFYEDYFPHYWKDVKKADGVFRDWFSPNKARTRPMEGSRSFTRKRTFPTHKDGREAGLTPRSDNPVDLFLWKIAEMSKYLMAHKLLKELKAAEAMRYVPLGKRPPQTPSGEPWTQINDRVATARYINDQGETVVAGGYYTPPSMAAVINNFLSPGLSGRQDAIGTGYRSLSAVNNAISLFVLGWDATQALMGGLNAVALQLNQTLADAQSGVLGNRAALKRTLVDGVQIPLAPLTLWLKGRKIVGGWAQPGVSPAIERANDWLVAGGGRPYRDQIYDVGYVNKLRQGWRNALYGRNLKTKAKGTAQSLGYFLPAATELVSDFLATHYIPQIKVAAHNQRMLLEMERLGPDATRDQVREASSRIWNLMDDVVGQMVYEKLHLHRVIEDALKLSVGRAGYQVGTLRLTGGAALDTLTAPVRFKRAVMDGGSGGKGGGGNRIIPGMGGASGSIPPELPLSDRMGALIGLVLAVAGAGTLLYMLLNDGKKPETMLDALYPTDGGKDEQGSPTRLSLPSRLQSVHSFVRDPRQFAANRQSPVLNVLGELGTNEDYFGRPIWHGDDSWPQAFADVGSYLARNYWLPASVRTGQQFMKERGYTLPQAAALGFTSISSAPKAVQRSKAQQLAAQLRRKMVPDEAITHADAARGNFAYELRSGMRRAQANENQPAAEAVRKQASDAYSQGQMSKRQALNIVEAQPTDWFTSLGLDDALKVWEVATPAEREKLKPLLRQKAQKTLKAEPAQVEPVLPKLREIFGSR